MAAIRGGGACSSSAWRRMSAPTLAGRASQNAKAAPTAARIPADGGRPLHCTPCRASRQLSASPPPRAAPQAVGRRVSPVRPRACRGRGPCQLALTPLATAPPAREGVRVRARVGRLPWNRRRQRPRRRGRGLATALGRWRRRAGGVAKSVPFESSP